jgi:spore germination cell wall hydrolase CwlJ-like protein
MTAAGLSLPAFRLSLPEGRQWLSMAVLAVAASLYLLAGFSIASIQRPAPGAGSRADLEAELPRTPPPAPEPLRFREIAPQAAEAINAAVPVSTGPNPAAQPLAAAFASEGDRLRAVECLTAAVYYEAAIEPTDGQRAVAQVVLNRVRHPAYPRTVCGVVFQGSERSTGCQFTFTCDGSMRRTPSAAGWARAKKVAEEALAGKVYAPVGLATHYHTNWVVPYWSSSLVKAANVGTHIFYRWAGGWGKPAAFRRGLPAVDPGMAAIRAINAKNAPTDAETVDEAAALAAAKANPDLTVGSASVDSFQRAVLRRYEPLSREAATDKAIARTGETAPASLRWALGGERPTGQAATPFGRKTADAPAAAAPAPPRCLEGVRRLPDNAQGKAAPQTC